MQNPVITNMTIPKTGTYTVTVTDVAGCSDTAETEVEIFPPPFVEIDPVNGSLCEDGDPVQLLGTPSGGVWTGEVDPDGVFDPQQAGEGLYVISYTITDGNGCTNKDQITIKVVPNIPAEITPPGPFCYSDQSVTLTANPPGGNWGGIADSDGQIYPNSLFPGSFEVTYELTGQDECYNTTIMIDIVTEETVYCPDITPVCYNTPPIQLISTPTGGTWSGGVTPDGIADPMMLGPGDHQVFYSYSSGTCPPNSCWTILTVYGAPSTLNLVETCDGTGMFYTVSFDISGGDAPSYMVNGTVSGTVTPGSPATFTSVPIPSGSAYSFQVFDSNHCDTVIVSGAHNCNCPTRAGTMDMTPFSVCEDDTVHILPPVGAILDPNDTLIYVLHTGDPTNFLLAGNGNEFVFGPPLQLGVTYFISVLVGNTITGVGVDLTDPCLAVTNGPTVTWNANPTGYLAGPPMVCTGDSATFSFLLTGTGPFDVTYSDGTTMFTLDSILSGHTETVLPLGNSTYTLLSVTDLFGPGCSTSLDTSLTIVVSDVIHAMQVLMICEGDSVFLAGDYQFSQGVYFDSISGTVGCDTILESYLIVNNLDTTYQNATTCDMAQVGVVENVLPNQFGCDSTIITTTTLITADTTLLNSTTCDPQAAGISTNTFQGQSGCDSVVIETILLLPSDTTHLSSGNCDVAATGVFTQVLTNSVGCDSVIIETVTLLPSDTTLLTASSCLPADTGTVSTLFQNIFGCDSLVVETTQLISSWLTLDTTTTCDPAASGTFTTDYVSSQGCDSTVIEEVILLPSDMVSLFDQTCEEADTGTVIQHYLNQYGCDSTVQFITTLLPADSCIEITHDVYVPNTFSPNNDDINDVLFLSSGPNSVDMILFFRIYDRWGSLVFERKNILPNDGSLGWDGKMLGKILNPGVFAWVASVQFLDGKETILFGNVTLVR
jgi:gliding motility-associated-like protein